MLAGARFGGLFRLTCDDVTPTRVNSFGAPLITPGPITLSSPEFGGSTDQRADTFVAVEDGVGTAKPNVSTRRRPAPRPELRRSLAEPVPLHQRPIARSGAILFRPYART